MKCLNCFISKSHTHAICWDKWQLCGNCVIKIHPEEYNLGSRVLKTRKRRGFSICECGELLVKLSYQKQRKIHFLDKYYCVKCGTIQ